MSPSMFNIIMDKIVRLVTEIFFDVKVGHIMVTDLDFAYDVMLMADTWLVLAALVVIGGGSYSESGEEHQLEEK